MRNYVWLFSLSIISLIFLSVPVSANPIMVGCFGAPLLLCFVYIFAAGLFVEFLVVYLFINKKLQSRSVLTVFALVMINNLITFPVAQLIFYELSAWTWMIGMPNLNLFLSEIFPIAAEYCLMKWQFNRLQGRNAIKEPISGKRIMLISLVANLSSFAAGIMIMVF